MSHTQLPPIINPTLISNISYINSSTSVGKNGFEHNNLVIFELKLHWVPQSFFGGFTWECVLLYEEMKIIHLVAQKPLRSELEIASKHHPLKTVTKGLIKLVEKLVPYIGWEQDF